MATPIIDFCIGFSQEEVEEILAEQKKELKKTISSYSESGSQIVKRRMDEIYSTISACQRALQKMDPELYGELHKTGISKVVTGFEF